VALTLQVVMAPERLDALLNEAEKMSAAHSLNASTPLSGPRNTAITRRSIFRRPCRHAPELLVMVKTLAAQIRKRVKRDVQTHLWPVFSSVQIERATTLAFNMPRVTPASRTRWPNSHSITFQCGTS